MGCHLFKFFPKNSPYVDEKILNHAASRVFQKLAERVTTYISGNLILINIQSWLLLIVELVQ